MTNHKAGCLAKAKKYCAKIYKDDSHICDERCVTEIMCICTESKCCEPDDRLYMSNPPQYKCKNCGQFWFSGKETPMCHKKEEKHGKNLCKTYHPDDCCTENPKCEFYEPKEESKECGCWDAEVHRNTGGIAGCGCNCHESGETSHCEKPNCLPPQQEKCDLEMDLVNGYIYCRQCKTDVHQSIVNIPKEKCTCDLPIKTQTDCEYHHPVKPPKEDWEKKVWTWITKEFPHKHSDRFAPLFEIIETLLQQERERLNQEASDGCDKYVDFRLERAKLSLKKEILEKLDGETVMACDCGPEERKECSCKVINKTLSQVKNIINEL